jgi:hypothetical protein
MLQNFLWNDAASVANEHEYHEKEKRLRRLQDANLLQPHSEHYELTILVV